MEDGGLVGGAGSPGRLLFPSQPVFLLVQSFPPVFQSSSWGYLGGGGQSKSGESLSGPYSILFLRGHHVR